MDIGQCIVCHENFTSTSVVTLRTCGHCYHPECINSVLVKKQECPTCRRAVDPAQDLIKLFMNEPEGNDDANANPNNDVPTSFNKTLNRCMQFAGDDPVARAKFACVVQELEAMFLNNSNGNEQPRHTKLRRNNKNKFLKRAALIAISVLACIFFWSLLNSGSAVFTLQLIGIFTCWLLTKLGSIVFDILNAIYEVHDLVDPDAI